MGKRLFLLIFSFILYAETWAQSVEFHFWAGTISESPLKARMETNISALLSAINIAEANHNNSVELSEQHITPSARRCLSEFWNNVQFKVMDNEIRSRCLNIRDGYEVTQIPILLTSVEGQPYRELSIRFDHSGLISAVLLAGSVEAEILKGGKDVTDFNRRLEILNFVEFFRQAYIEKDTATLNKIFADDAIIISGTVIQSKKINESESHKLKVHYRKENKEEYLNRLATQIFRRNKFIDVKFDEISVAQHPEAENIYGVTLHQDWASIHHGDIHATAGRPSYQDEGWVFLLWEFFDDGTPPVIHVRTWQPDKIITNKDSIIKITDFEVK